MGLEIELKAGLSQADARAVEHILDTRWGQGDEGKTLRARYYDSQDARLAAKRIALRIRAERGALVQTVKAGGSGLGGFHQLGEVETVVPGWQVDLDAIPDPALRAEMEAALGDAPLEMRFETDVLRRRWLVQHDHGLVDVVLDRGFIRASGAADSVLELEFELKEGSPEALFQLAADLLGPFPVLLTLPSKAGRGQALLHGKPWRPKIAGGKPVPAEAGEEGEASWRRALAASAMAVGTNLYLLATSEDAEAAHQLRVALRRFRAALTLHRPLLAADVANSLAEGAREIGRIVAPLRDYDVQAAAYVEERALAQAFRERRAALRADVIAGLRGANASAFAIRLLGLASVGGWRAQGRVKPSSIECLSSRAFTRLWKPTRRLGDGLSTLEDEDRHEFRKKLKKIRYLLEIYPKNDSSKFFLEKLKKLQEELGFLNDISASEAWKPELPEPLAKLFEEARLLQQKPMQQRADLALGRACRQWRDLRKLAGPLQQHREP